jgi:hypothetical protein
MMRAALVLALLAAASPAFAQAVPQGEGEEQLADQVRIAKRDFEHGDYARAAQRLAQLVEVGRFQTLELRAEAYRLLGQALLLQTPPREAEAHRAFQELLLLDPDTELDPFFVPPRVIDFFEAEKKELAPQLSPVRAQRRAEKELRRKQREEDASRRRVEDEQKAILKLQPVVERRVIQREFWVSLLPFGLGQMQNGDRKLGYTLATLEIVFGAMSAGSAFLIEGLRDNATQKFGPREYQIATKLEITKWIGAAAFFGLWAAGAIDAAARFKPETTVEDRLLIPPAAGSSQPPVMPPTQDTPKSPQPR